MKYFVSMSQTTGNAEVRRVAPKANESAVVKKFFRCDHGAETLYKAQDYMATLK